MTESIDGNIGISPQGYSPNVASKGSLADLVFLGTSSSYRAETFVLELDQDPSNMFRLTYHNEGIHQKIARNIIHFLYGIPGGVYSKTRDLATKVGKEDEQSQRVLYDERGQKLLTVYPNSSIKKGRPNQKVLHDTDGNVLLRVDPSKEANHHQRVLYDTTGDIISAVNWQMGVEGSVRSQAGQRLVVRASRIATAEWIILVNKGNPSILYLK